MKIAGSDYHYKQVSHVNNISSSGTTKVEAYSLGAITKLESKNTHTRKKDKNKVGKKHLEFSL